MTTDMMPVLIRLMALRETLNDPQEQAVGLVPARHFLDVADDRSRPTVKRLVKAILDHHKWSIATLSSEDRHPRRT